MGWTAQYFTTIYLQGPGPGIFVYKGTPGPGTLIGSWAAAAGSDPYGNSYPQGLYVAEGTIEGPAYVLNSSGLFIYAGAPAAGSLIGSVASGYGTDPFGNPYNEGIWAYGTDGSSMGMVPSGGQSQFHFTPSGEHATTADAMIYAQVNNSGLSNEYQYMLLTSGQSDNERAADLILASEPADASASEYAQVQFGGIPYLTLNRNGMQLAQGTPLSVAGQPWQDMTLANGWTVGSGGMARYRLRPDNTVEIQLVNLIPGTTTDGTGIWVFPSGFTPVAEQKLDLIVSYSTAPSYGSMPFLYTNPGGDSLQVYDLRGSVSAIHATARYSLD